METNHQPAINLLFAEIATQKQIKEQYHEYMGSDARCHSLDLIADIDSQIQSLEKSVEHLKLAQQSKAEQSEYSYNGSQTGY